MFGLLPPSLFRLFERLHGVCAGEHRGRVQWHELSMWQKLICGFGRYGDTCNKLGILRTEKLEVLGEMRWPIFYRVRPVYPAQPPSQTLRRLAYSNIKSFIGTFNTLVKQKQSSWLP